MNIRHLKKKKIILFYNFIYQVTEKYRTVYKTKFITNSPKYCCLKHDYIKNT